MVSPNGEVLICRKNAKSVEKLSRFSGGIEDAGRNAVPRHAATPHRSKPVREGRRRGRRRRNGFVLAVVHEGIVLHARLAASKPRRLHGMEEKEETAAKKRRAEDTTGRKRKREKERRRTDGSGTRLGSARLGSARPQAARGAGRRAREAGNAAENRLAIALNRRGTMILEPAAVARATSELLVDE